MKTNLLSYRGYRFPHEIIRNAVWLYHRFCLSFRDVEDPLAQLVVMDQYTRRIIGFGVQPGIVDGIALCRMFNQAIRGGRCRSTSAPTTIRCIDLGNGKPICEFWR
jgi:hypothetical protein